MGKFKKLRTLSLLIVGVLSSVLFLGCSCSKKIKPTGITIDKTEAVLYVGDTVDVKYTIAPPDSTSTKVDVVVSDPTTVSVSQTSFEAIEGTLTITASLVNVSGVTVTFKIDGTDLQASLIVKVKPDPVKLSSVSGIAYNPASKSIIFKNAPNTQKYLVNIDGTDYSCTDPSTSTTEHFIQFPIFNDNVELALNEVHTVKVKPLGDGEAYSDGDYSEEYKFLKYAQVTNITANNGVVTWDAHNLATKYSIKVNGNELVVMPQTNSYVLNETEPGEYNVQVAAVSPSTEDENGVKLFASDYSENYKITKLANCVLTLDNERVDEEGVLGESVVTFPAILGATSYKVKVTPQIGDTEEFVITENFVEIDDRFSVNVDYTIEITPLGDASNTISAGSTTINLRKLGTIGEAEISNNIMTIDGIAQASKYAIILVSQTDKKYIVNETTSVDLAEQIPAYGTFKIFVRPIGQVTENITMANGTLFDTELTITKIVNPEVSAVNNDGTVHWGEIAEVASYSVYVNDYFVNSSATNTYKIDTTQLEAGEHNVKIVAVGNGTTTISSGKANAIEFVFTKLPKISAASFAVENDVVKFDGVENALDYSVKFNDGNYRLIGKVEGKQSVAVSNPVNGTNEIYAVAVGDDVRIISSSPTKFTVTRLDAPTNLRIENGVLVWNGTNGTKYRIYIGEDDEFAETTETSCDNLQGVAGELVVKVKTVPTSGNYISSDFGTINVIKLPMVAEGDLKVVSIADHNELSNYKLTWPAVENSTGYNLSIYTEDMAEPDLYTGYQYTEINLSESYPAGVYAVKIVAVGNSATETAGYVNSSPTEIEFRKLNKPTGLQIVNNQLIWQDAEGDTPSGYKLGIKYGTRDEIFVTVQTKIYEFDLSKFAVDEDVTVRIRALGDNVGSVTGAYCDNFVVSRARTVSGVMVKNGEVTWNPLVDVTANYLVYGTLTPDNASSYTLLTTVNAMNADLTMSCSISGLEVNRQYSIYIVSSVEGMLNSDPSSVLKITKLPTVQNFKIENNTFSWDAVANATKYVVVDGNGNKKETTGLTLDFDDFEYTANGDYSFRVYAVGTSENVLEGYINSNVNTSITVTILEIPNSVSIVNNKLVIINSRKNLPTSYTIEIENTTVADYGILLIEGLPVEVPAEGSTTSITELDLYELPLIDPGSYTFSIYGVGNNKELIDSKSPLIIEAIEKLNEDEIGVKVLNGEVVWTKAESTTYDVYINDNLVIADTDVATIDFNQLKTEGKFVLQKDVNTKVQVVAKKQGAISSEKTDIFTVVKLPDVKGFKITETSIDATIVHSEYRFTWTPLQDVTDYNYNYGNDLNSFYYEVIKTSGGDLTDKELVGEEIITRAINLKTDNAVTTAIAFEYGKTVSGTFKFNISAKGTKDSGEKAYGFINGDVCENPISVTILSALSLNQYVRAENKLILNNANNEGGNRASKIKVAYEAVEPAEGADKYLYTTELDKAATEYYVTYPNDEDFTPGLYKIWFGVVGKLNSGDYILSPRESYCQKFELLNPVTEFYSTNGYLNWTHEGAEGVQYQIYIDGELATYSVMVEVTPEDPDPEDPENSGDPENSEDSNEPEQIDEESNEEDDETQYELVVFDSFVDQLDARKINDVILMDTLNHRIRIKAIREPGDDTTIIYGDSELSGELLVQKLEGVFAPYLSEGYIYWDKVDNATGYIIRSESGEMNEIFSDKYDAERDGYFASGNNAGESGVMMPTNIPAADYTFYIVSEGSTTATISEMAYLTSGRNGSCETTVLASPYAIKTVDGVACWDEVAGNSGYKVEVYKCKLEEINEKTSCESFVVDQPNIDFDNETKYPSGYYAVKVYTLGDGESYLNSSSANPTSQTLYKAPKANSLGGQFKVRNGYLSWSVPLTNSYMYELNRNENYTSEAYSGLLLAAKGDSAADNTMAQNLEFFRNLEVKINNKIYQNQTVFKVELDEVKKELIYYYDFNFSTIKNPYTLSVRFMGGSRTPVMSGDMGGGEMPPEGGGEIMSLNNRRYTTQILEEPVEGGGETPPAGGETNFNQNLFLVLNGNYSSAITGYKLPPPQTPVGGVYPVEGKVTMVYADHLYFAKVFMETGYTTDYLIIADCMDSQKEDLEFYINSSNRSKYEQSMTETSGVNAYFKVPVVDIGIETGYVYTLKVKALGTADSGSSTSGVYFTSNYDHSCEVEMLAKPNIAVTNGDVAVSTIQTAVKQEIRIWSTALGATYQFNESAENPTGDPNKVAQLITLTPAGADEENPHYSFVSVENGYFVYSFIENGYFPQGSYYVTSRAIGNGITKISSTSAPVNTITGEATFKVHKFGKITTMSLVGGKFRWERVSYNNGAGVSEIATMYSVEILCRKENNYEFESLDTEIVTYDERYCYYDLDSLLYPATDAEGNRLEYAIKVSPLGTIDSNEVIGAQNYFVSGDPDQSHFYKRLLPPQDVVMKNGKLSWREVEGGYEYEVYRLDDELQEGETEYSYSLVSEDNFRYLEFKAPEAFGNEVFNIRIRAIPGSETMEYLNGEYCIEILAKRLERPLLRVEDGVIKWNNTDLNYAIATGVTVKLQRLANETDQSGTVIIDEEYDITAAVNSPEGYRLVGTDEDVPSGYYKIEVSYLGSNGYVTKTDFEDETEGEGEEGEGGEGPGEEPPVEEGPTEPGEGEEGGEGEDEEDIFADLGNYCWFSSAPASMTFFKLPTPVADLSIGTKNDAPINNIAVARVTNARYYQFTVRKYNKNGEVIKEHTFSAFDSYSTPDENSYYSMDANYIMFNVQAVADLDALAPDQPNPFGQEFSVYCQVYGEDRLYDSAEGKYSMSNNSNEVAIEVPLTPSNLYVISSTGEIGWTNASNNTWTRVRIYYNGSTTPVIANLEPGTNRFKIQTMGSYDVSVLSYIKDDINDLEITSAYSESETGECWIFASGSGTAEDPYMLEESKHVINIDYYLDSYFKFGKHITLSETDLSQNVTDFVIGRKSGNVFNGTIDGDGYSLNNVRFAFRQLNQVALIRQIGANGVVKNLKVGINSGSGSYRAVRMGGITIVNNGRIENVQTKPYTLSGKDGELLYYPLDDQRIAGIAVENNGTIINSVNNMLIKKYTEISNMKSYVSGIVSVNNKNAVVQNCGNTGELNGVFVGGIAIFNYSQISYCYSTGNITAQAFESSIQAKAAGIVVNNMDTDNLGDGTVSTCYVIIDKLYVSGLANGSATHYGAGIVCDNSSTNSNSVDNCYVVLGTVSVSGGTAKPGGGTDNKFGTIVAVDDSRATVSNYYNSDYYYVYGTINIAYGAHGDTTKALTGVSNSANKTSLVTSLTTSLGSIYKNDNTSINNGYPVFEWQLTGYTWKA